MTKLRTWRWKDYPRLHGLVQYNHRGPYKKEAGVSAYEKEI